MTGKLPLPGLFLAALGAFGLAVAGVSLWLVAAVLLIWGGSLWLTLPEPEVAEARVDKAVVTRDAVREAIESLGAPLLVLDVWEHAFLLDYKPSDRPKYIDAIFSNVDWPVVDDRLRRGAAARRAA